MDFDMNWWGLYAMPIGVALCFGPVLVAWAMCEPEKPSRQQAQPQPSRPNQKKKH